MELTQISEKLFRDLGLFSCSVCEQAVKCYTGPFSSRLGHGDSDSLPETGVNDAARSHRVSRACEEWLERAI